jgi:hypothetical protein
MTRKVLKDLDMYLISDYSFSQSDQIEFAKLSGDWNPIHVDPVFARRTIYGQVVHGIHIFLVALDAFLSVTDNPTPSEVHVSFLSPLNLDQTLSVEVVHRGNDIILEVKSLGKVITFIRMSIGDGLKRVEITSKKSVSIGDISKIPKERKFDDLRNVDCDVDLSNDIEHVSDFFGSSARRIGKDQVAAILGLSKFVGMEYPGMHSLFSGFSLRFSEVKSHSLRFQTERFSIPNAPIKFSFNGSGIKGTLDAFLRPAPYKQLDVGVVSRSVLTDEFQGQNALIIGGSRGLGELTAKIIASGGGKVDITYALGGEDADEVCREINELNNGLCEAHRINFYEDYEDSLAGLVQQLRPTHIYYFSSPRIRGSKEIKLDLTLLDEYMNFYVKVFNYLCQIIPDIEDVKVFYPSTKYIDDSDNNFKEYILAKIAGESLCNVLNTKYSEPRFIFQRLPKVKTDQTQSFIQDSGIEAADLLLDIVRKL